LRNTKARLLDAAERLFSEHGVDNVSVRMITGAAEANLSALGFHYGTREALVKAVFLRRLLPLADERRENLARLQAGGSMSAPAILNAFFDPVLRMSRSGDAGEQAFLKVLSRTLVDPSPQYREILGGELAGLLDAYLDAFQAAMPGYSRAELAGRLDFAVGAVGHALSDPERAGLGAGEARLSAVERVIPQVMAFVTAGFTAPPAAPGQSAPPSPAKAEGGAKA
jgi:AcrR family transcriptional regulator